MANRNFSATSREDLSVVRDDGTYHLVYIDPRGGLIEKDGTPVPKGSAPPTPPGALHDIPTLVYDDNGTVRPVYRTTGGLVESDGTPVKITNTIGLTAPLPGTEDTDMPASEDTDGVLPAPLPDTEDTDMPVSEDTDSVLPGPGPEVAAAPPGSPQLPAEDTDMPASEDTNIVLPGPGPEVAATSSGSPQLPTLPSLVPDAVATSSGPNKRLAAKANPEPARQTTTVRHRYLFDLEIDDNGKVIPPPGHKPVQVSPLTLVRTISLILSFF